MIIRAVPLLLLGVLLSGCSSNWGWYVVNPTTPSGYANLWFLLSGLYYTILLSVTAILISVTTGLLVALPGFSENRFLRGLNRTYVEIVRAVPILVLILWVYYGLPQIAGISISIFWAVSSHLRCPIVRFRQRFSALAFNRSIAGNTRRPIPSP